MPSFIEDVSAIVDRIGVRYPGVVLGLSQIQWESAEDRDAFLDALVSDGGPQ